MIASIPALVRQHAQDAAFLWTQRMAEIDGPLFSAEDVGRRDQRLAANIDGLVAAGPKGREIAREGAQAQGGTGEWFVLTALALETGDATEVEQAAGMALDSGPAGARGLSGATGWSLPLKVSGPVRRWLASDDPRRRRLGVAALSHHRVDPGKGLAALLDDPDPATRSAAARLAGNLGRTDMLPRLRTALEEEGDHLWPAWAGTRMNDGEALAALLRFVRQRPDDRQAGFALDLALVALGPRAAGELTTLLGRPETRVLALSRAGVPGDASILPWLIERMRSPETAHAAGCAFRDLFANDIRASALFTDDAASLGPGFAGLDTLPLPVADRIADWPGPDPGHRPFVSQRARMLASLRAGVAAPTRPLAPWRHRQPGPAWV